MAEGLNECELIWQCPDCGCVNHNDGANVLLVNFKCKQCNEIYALRKKIIQVLCEPIKTPVDYASKTL